MQTEKFQPEGKRIMSETRFTDFLALSVDPRVGISWSASKNWKNAVFIIIFLFIFDFISQHFMAAKRYSEFCVTNGA